MATIAAASLRARERRMVDRYIERLVAECGNDLKAVWLFGSRARADVLHGYSDVCFNAASAALSEEDRFAKTHDCTWGLVSELLVKTGKLEADLNGRAHALKPAREMASTGRPTSSRRGPRRRTPRPSGPRDGTRLPARRRGPARRVSPSSGGAWP